MTRLLLAALALAACDGRAPRSLSADLVRHATAAAPPAGAMPRGAAAARAAVATRPTATDGAAGAHGYRDFCAPCHGARGDGDGTVIARGFTAPRPFATLAPADRDPARTVAIITRGYGKMLPQAEQVAPAERWAIAGHVEALAARGVADAR